MLPGVQFISRLKMTLIGGVQESFLSRDLSPWYINIITKFLLKVKY